MQTIKLGPRDAASISHSLQTLGQTQGAPEDLRRNAAHWAGAVRRKMDPRDVRRMAWVFRDASGLTSVPFDCQDEARYWAAYLEGRLDPI